MTTRLFSLSGRLAGLAVAAAIGVSALAGGAAAQSFGDAQKQEIGRIVRDYLVQNPEVIQEAIAELERRQGEAQKTAQSQALKDSQEALLRSVNGNVVANPSGDVTLVEFFDYNCGYCKRALADVLALAKTDPKLRIVLKDFPVLGPESVEASKVALAVKQQLAGDRLLDYHTKLLSTRGRVDGARATQLAREMGLDLTRLAKDLDGPQVKAALAENGSLGERLALTGTPAFIVGDEVISGAVGIEPLRQAVAGVRQCGHALC